MVGNPETPKHIDLPRYNYCEQEVRGALAARNSFSDLDSPIV